MNDVDDEALRKGFERVAEAAAVGAEAFALMSRNLQELALLCRAARELAEEEQAPG